MLTKCEFGLAYYRDNERKRNGPNNEKRKKQRAKYKCFSVILGCSLVGNLVLKKVWFYLNRAYVEKYPSALMNVELNTHIKILYTINLVI